MNVSVSNKQKSLVIVSSQIKKIAIEVVRFEKKEYDEVAIHLVDKKTISRLHVEYFDDPSPTDCISFPVDEEGGSGYRVLGDVFVCTEVALEYAISHHLDPYEEVTLYIVHGLLHLMGYDDIDKGPRAKMRAAEQRQMKHLNRLGLCLKNPSN